MERCQAILPIVVVLPVPLTPTIRSTAGSPLRSIGARAGAGDLGEDLDQPVAHRLAVGGDGAAPRPRARAARRPRRWSARRRRRGSAPPRAAPRSRRRSGRRGWPRSPRPAPGGSWRGSRAGGGRRRGAARRPQPRRGVRALARTQVEDLLPGRRHRIRRARGYPGGAPELLDGDSSTYVADRLEVADGVAVGEQAEADRAVVADDRDRQRVAAGEEADRVDARPARGRARRSGICGPGEVGDEQVEEPGREVDRRGRAEQQRRSEVAEPVVEPQIASAPSGCLEALSSSIALETIRRRSTGSATPTGSGPRIAVSRLPSSPCSFSVRTETGTRACSSTPSVSSVAARASSGAGRRPRPPA